MALRANATQPSPLKRGEGWVRGYKMMMKNKIFSITLIVFLVGLFTVSVFVVGIYKFDWENAAAKNFAQIIPLPAAVVGGKFVPLSDFWKLEMAHNLTGESSSRGIIDILIRDKIVEILAKEKKNAISSQELEQYYLHLLVRFGLNERAAGQGIYQHFGITEEDFKRLVVVPDLTRNKLAIWWQEESRPNSAANRMKEAERKLLEGLTFRDAARLYSDEEQSKYIGGDLGFVVFEEIEPWFRDTVSGLKTGDMSRVVVGPDGFYLFQVAAQDSVKNEIQIKQIFIRNEGFEEFFAEQMARFRVLVFKKI